MKRGAAGGRVEREPLEVVVVEVPVGHAHRLAAVVEHRLQRGRVVVGREQRHLAADQLRVLARPAELAQQRHLRVDLGHRVAPVDAHAVGLARVVTRGAGEVAAREHAVRALAAGRAAAEHLVRRLDVRRQLLPAPRERGRQVRVLRPREDLELAQVHRAHTTLPPRPRGRNAACRHGRIWSPSWLGSRSSWRPSARPPRSTTASGGSCGSRASSASSPVTGRSRRSGSGSTR